MEHLNWQKLMAPASNEFPNLQLHHLAFTYSPHMLNAFVAMQVNQRIDGKEDNGGVQRPVSAVRL